MIYGPRISICLLAFSFLFSLPCNADDIFVTHLTDDLTFSDGTCTLREAIFSANTDAVKDACPAGNGDDVIYFTQSGRIELIAGLPHISANLHIVGPGAELLTIDANSFDSVLYISVSGDDGDYAISGLTLTGGRALTGGGIFFFQSGSLSIKDSIITGNEAVSTGSLALGGGVHIKQGDIVLERVSIFSNSSDNNGGGLSLSTAFADGISLTITNSTIRDNHADQDGGGIFIAATSAETYTITSSTISGNTAAIDGGGIHAVSGILDISHCTLTNNSAGTSIISGSGGGFRRFSGTTSFYNTIVAGNFDLAPTDSDYPDIYLLSSNYSTFGHNFVGNNEGHGNLFFHPSGNPNVDGDYIGTTANPAVADLDAITDNGGPTFTHLPSNIPNNNLVDRGDCLGEPYDQRGRGGSNDGPRIVDLTPANSGDGCDIGAVEANGIRQKVELDLKVILSGPYTNVLMSTDLNQGGHLPTDQPYSIAPWNYSGTESISTPSADMVDWVLVHLMKGIPGDVNPTIISTRAAILHDNGEIFAVDENSPLSMGPQLPGAYYVLIEHRNHLGVVSSIPILANWDDAVNYDFSDSLSKAYSAGGAAMNDLGSGFFGLWGGDGDANKITSSFDFLNTWLPVNGSPAAYLAGDFDMNGLVTAFDFLQVWLPANGQASQVPN